MYMAYHPWNLILYADEVVPGNQMHYDNLRKEWVMYFSFKELGVLTLGMEEAWFLAAAIRSKIVDDASGGISQVFSACIKLFFQNLHADLATSGMVLRHPDGSQTQFATLVSMSVPLQVRYYVTI